MDVSYVLERFPQQETLGGLSRLVLLAVLTLGTFLVAHLAGTGVGERK